MSLLVWPCAASAGRQPSRTYYQVLNISPDEQDPKIIEEAAVRCSGHVRAYQLTHEFECTLRLNEIAQALITLLDPAHRREYDLRLGSPFRPAVSECEPPAKREPPVRPRSLSAPTTPGRDTLAFLIEDGGSCDVKLVYRQRAL